MNTEMTRFCDRNRIKAECRYGAKKPMVSGGIPGGSDWRVTLKHGRKRLTVDFFQGPAHCEEPTAADVLSCLCSDASAGSQDFEEFCRDFGYDLDSRKALRTWKACASMAERLPRFLGDLYEAACNCQH